MNQMKVQVNPATLEDWSCPECGNKVFIAANCIKKLPRVYSPDGTPGFTILAIGFQCISCSKVYPVKELLANIMKEESQTPEESNGVIQITGGNRKRRNETDA